VPDQPSILAPQWTPVIDWSAFSAQRLTDKPPVDTPAWLSDFLNNLGQDEAHRNPNARVRISMPSVSVAKHV
jgi:hypothetical protein